MKFYFIRPFIILVFRPFTKLVFRSLIVVGVEIFPNIGGVAIYPLSAVCIVTQYICIIIRRQGGKQPIKTRFTVVQISWINVDLVRKIFNASLNRSVINHQTDIDKIMVLLQLPLTNYLDILIFNI